MFQSNLLLCSLDISDLQFLCNTLRFTEFFAYMTSHLT